MNLREETRDFNNNPRQIRKNGFETHTNTEKEEKFTIMYFSAW